MQKAVKGISPKALTDSLRHMEKNEILIRTVYPTVPVKVEYSLTEKGEDLHSIIKQMKVGVQNGDKQLLFLDSYLPNE